MPFILSRSTQIVADARSAPIQNAMDILERDMRACLTEAAAPNRLTLSRDGALQPEAYALRVEPNRAVLRYADDLGAVYGLLMVSERFLGVQPLDFWNERPAPTQPVCELPEGEYASPARAVRLRGWFVNDEVLLDGWAKAQNNRLDMWRRVFETLLRLGGNMVLPGTDRKDDGEELEGLASDMGLWLTQHHAELLGARMFARAYPGVRAAYSEHPELFEALWRESAKRLAGRRVVWAVGYRAQGDAAFWVNEKGFDTPEARGGMITRVVNKQMDIVRKENPDARFCTNIYGEMAGLYRSGDFQVPNGVIKVWADNGYGKMVNRRDGNLNPRVSSMPENQPGPNGLYYHVSFYDLQAANHIAMSPNAPAMLAGELQRVLDCGANEYWLINVGSIKPHTYLIDLVSHIWNEGRVNVDEHARAYALAYYRSAEIGPLLQEFSRHTLPYGPNDDDRAGDQYYHFVTREIARALMSGETRGPVARLKWAADDESFSRQVGRILKLCQAGIPGWDLYLRRLEKAREALDEKAALLMDDTLLLQARLHLTGCRALYSVCRAAECLRDGQPMDAFLLVHRALVDTRNGVAALQGAEHGPFEGYYQNDCFTNVRLTAQVLEALRAWVRVVHDDRFYTWERECLYAPGDRRVYCLSHRENQLTDEALAEGLMAVAPPEG